MPHYLKTKPITASSDTSQESVSGIVKGVIEAIRSKGDSAVRDYSEKFDKWSPSSFRLSKSDIETAVRAVPEQTIKDIKEVQANVRAFAQAQRDSIKDFEIETQPGVHLGQKNLPINSVGAYIPGGRYPLLASAHMTILTAKVAGVKNVIACTPPIAGKIPNATVAASMISPRPFLPLSVNFREMCDQTPIRRRFSERVERGMLTMNSKVFLAGADEIFILGGVQAVAAMAVGTETIRKMDFLAGPGNAFVAEAKRQLFGEVGIDLFAGPTEILIVADDFADPFTIATDLVSQAEHGP
jgi:histidinol dehydrogenase